MAAAQAVRAQQALNFTVQQDLSVGGKVSAAKLNATPTEVGPNGWNIAQDFAGVGQAAIRLPSGPGNPGVGMQLGLHGDGHVYFTNADTGASLASVDRQGVVYAAGGLQLRGFAPVTAIQSGSTCTNTATGTINFPASFAAVPHVLVTPHDTNGNGCTSVRTVVTGTDGFSFESFTAVHWWHASASTGLRWCSDAARR